MFKMMVQKEKEIEKDDGTGFKIEESKYRLMLFHDESTWVLIHRTNDCQKKLE